jgi:mediator of RNA polymerase II transcription subunit 12
MSTLFPGGSSNTLLPPKPPALAVSQHHAQSVASAGVGGGKTLSAMADAHAYGHFGMMPSDGVMSGMIGPDARVVIESTHSAASSQQTRVSDIKPERTWQTAPFPTRPGQGSLLWKQSVPLGMAVLATNANGNETRVQGDPPPCARVYPKGREFPTALSRLVVNMCTETADYFPWRGNHLEDIMSEQTVKTGFQNKPLITNESNTARPSVYHHLRNKGTQSLSALFVTLLEKRQTSNRITAPSTFKLPPRLTMPTSRRETFLRELADPSKPLRKLNRSIPHAIAGRGLLDQCLSRKIPIPRATWLAKCIGAHDIRAIKRKSASGTGPSSTTGEAKWIREWTIQVQNFIKSAFLGAGQVDWKANLDYVIRLSTNLYYERLLDEDHFLDWMLSGFEASAVEHLPIWLLFIHIYWKDLTATRKKGRKLADTLLLHLEQMSPNNFDGLLSPVVDRMSQFLLKLAIGHVGCLILPKSWSRYRPVLQNLEERVSRQDMKFTISALIRRNDRLIGKMDKEQKSRGVIEILDSWTGESDETEVLQQCLQIKDDVDILVNIVMRWASSVYRHGRYRTYLGARLLRKLQSFGNDIDQAVWTSVEQLSQSSSCREVALHQIVVELIRTQQFKVGRFLQYLISKGLPHPGASSQEAPLVRLLCSLPINGQFEQVKNLQEILLESSGISLAEEHEHSASIKSMVKGLVTAIVANETPKSKDVEHIAKTVASLDVRQRFAFGFWMRRIVLDQLEDAPEPNGYADPGTKMLENLFLLSRTVLEITGELSCLADLMMAFMDFNGQNLLASLAQTMHFNHQSYMAFSAMKPLFDKLVSRYEHLRARQPLEKPFCSALLSLATSLNANQTVLQQALGDLHRCDQMAAAAAMCSPASDNAMDTSVSLSADATVSDADIDRCLTSGTSMDENLFDRLFKRICIRMREAWESGQIEGVPVGYWLSKLKTFGPVNFDTKFKGWVGMTLGDEKHSEFLYGYVHPVSIAAECLSIPDLVKCFEETQLTDSPVNMFMARLRFIKSLIPDQQLDVFQSSESYKYRLDKQIYARMHSTLIFSHLGELLRLSHDISKDGQSDQLVSFLQSSELLSFLTTSLSSEDRSVEAATMILTNMTDTLTSPLCGLVESLLDPNHAMELTNTSPAVAAKRVLENMNELSLPFSTLWIRAKYLQLRPNLAGDDWVAEAVSEAIITGSEGSSGVMGQMLGVMDPGLRFKVSSTAHSFDRELTSVDIRNIQNFHPRISRSRIDSSIRPVVQAY